MQYLIITNKGFWGKGSSALEAAENAHIRSSNINCTLMVISEKLVQPKSLHCTDMGAQAWSWTDQLMSQLGYDQEAKQYRDQDAAIEAQHILTAINRGHCRTGKIKVIKKEVIFTENLSA